MTYNHIPRNFFGKNARKNGYWGKKRIAEQENKNKIERTIVVRNFRNISGLST